jgi:hypothetical protein
MGDLRPLLKDNRKNDSEKWVLWFKWVQTGSEKVPMAKYCGRGGKEQKISERAEHLRTSRFSFRALSITNSQQSEQQT